MTVVSAQTAMAKAASRLEKHINLLKYTIFCLSVVMLVSTDYVLYFTSPIVHTISMHTSFTSRADGRTSITPSLRVYPLTPYGSRRLDSVELDNTCEGPLLLVFRHLALFDLGVFFTRNRSIWALID